jgi:isoleucyl-tRNA synthetase
MKEAAAVIASLSEDQIEHLSGGGGMNVAGTTITGADLVIERRPVPGTVVAANEDLAVALDLESDPKLEAEGLAREVVSRIQQMRRETGLAVTDRITLAWWTDDPVLSEAIETHGSYISSEVLASEMNRDENLNESVSTLDIDGTSLSIQLEKV